MTRPARRRTGKPQPPAEESVVRIDAVGSRGDGLAEADGRRLYVPLTVPGDLVRVRPGTARGDGRAADLIDILAPGPGRISPACPHFGACGGCAVQHWAANSVADWKREQVVAALDKRGLDAPVSETRSLAPGNRRRADFRVVRIGKGTVFGFHRRAGTRVIGIGVCPVLDPDLTTLIGPLRDLMERLRTPSRDGGVLTTLTETGADILLTWSDEPGLEDRAVIADFAVAHPVARISWAGSPQSVPEPLIQLRPPRVRLAGVAVEPPPGPFLQPSATGEAALQALVCGAAAGARRVADLFAGLGTFSLALARESHVQAVEQDPQAVAALARAAGAAGLGGRIAAESRDLNRATITPEELKGIDAVVFDPPRAGARAQAESLANSAVPTVAAVSCNPATLGRDLRILVDGGYRIDAVTPVDQFPWTAHVEAVAVLRRA